VLLAEVSSVGVDVVDVGEVAVALVEVEAVADEVLVGNGEADVAHCEILHQSPVRTVEERRRGEGARIPEEQRLAQVVEREAGVDDVLDDEHVASIDPGVEILQEPHAGRLRAARIAVVGGEFDEVQVVQDRRRAREVGEEDEARLERRDEEGLEAVVVRRNLGSELRDPASNLVPAEVNLADPSVYARLSLYR
jgi:hypothetical protein